MNTITSIYTDGTYAAQNPDWHSEDSEWKAGQIIRAITLADIAPKTIAEVGCGAGAILSALKAKIPASYFGYDISPYAIQMAQKHEGIIFKNGSIAGTYDLVLGIDILEHIEDVFGFLREMRSHGRKFIFHIPLDMNCHGLLRGLVMSYRKSVGHIHYFSKDTALALLEECGYSVRHWFYTPVVDLHPSMSSSIRKILFRLFPDTTVKSLGVYSLMVVAE